MSKDQNNQNKKIHKFYESPLDYGVFYRFEEAVRILSTESGSLNKRLYRAYYDGCIFHLGSDNFNDDFIRSRLRDVEMMADKGLQNIIDIKLPPDYHIN